MSWRDLEKGECFERNLLDVNIEMSKLFIYELNFICILKKVSCKTANSQYVKAVLKSCLEYGKSNSWLLMLKDDIM